MQSHLKNSKTPYNITIVGGGLTGNLASLYLASLGYSVTHIIPLSTTIDDRTTALMLPAIQLLNKLNINKELEPVMAPLRAICLIDESHSTVTGPTVIFKAKDIGEKAFGYNIPNKELNSILQKNLETNPNINIIRGKVVNIKHGLKGSEIELDNNEKIETDIVIGADGSNSICREAAEIKSLSEKLPQVACVLSFSHEQPHNDMSIEFQTPYGPFTQVPLIGKNSSLVWVVPEDMANAYQKLPKEEINKMLAEKLSHYLGEINLTSEIQLWPLKKCSAQQLACNNTILIGEAAHMFPPLGAQGLNLTVRDIIALDEALQQPSKEEVLSFYQHSRSLDIKSRSCLVNNLNQSLLSSFIPIKLFRALSLSLIKKSSFLRNLIAHEMLEPKRGLDYLKSFFKRS